MLLGDADVERALGEPGLEVVEPHHVHHGGGDRDHVLATMADADDLVGEDVGPDLAARVLLAGLDVEGLGRVELVGLVPFGGVVAEALAGDGVHDDGPAEPLGLGERLLHRHPVVAVDGADVLETEVLEEPLWGNGVLHALLHGVEDVVRRRADAADRGQPLLDQVEDLLVAGVGAQRRERVGEAADRGRVGPAVVVDDDHQLAVAGDGDVVQRLPGHAAGEGAVADDGHDVAVLATDGVGLGQPVGVAEGGGGVGVLDDVVVGLGLARVAAQAALLAEPVELGPAAGQELVDVGLVAGVEDHPVTRGVEDPVDGQGELDDAEVGAEVSAGAGAGRDEEVADLAGQQVELVVGEVAQVPRGRDRLEVAHGGESIGRGPQRLVRAGCPSRPCRRAPGRR